MLLAHGTTERNADLIYSCGYFAPLTYFLKCDPDPKLALFGTAGFGLRHHTQTKRYIDLYCKQDLIMRLFKKSLIREANKWLCGKEYDKSPGLIFIVKTEEYYIDHHRGILNNFFVPVECFSLGKIPTDSIEHIVTLEENVERFQKKYGEKTIPLERTSIDHILLRTLNTLYTRYLRFFSKKEIKSHNGKKYSL